MQELPTQRHSNAVQLLRLLLIQLCTHASKQAWTEKYPKSVQRDYAVLTELYRHFQQLMHSCCLVAMPGSNWLGGLGGLLQRPDSQFLSAEVNYPMLSVVVSAIDSRDRKITTLV